MLIENNKQKNKDATNESFAYTICIIVCIGIAFVCEGLRQEVFTDTSTGYLVATIFMWIFIFSAVALLVAAIGTGAGWGGKRDKIDDVF